MKKSLLFLFVALMVLVFTVFPVTAEEASVSEDASEATETTDGGSTGGSFDMGNIIMLIGGVAFFLYGMSIMSNGL
ncbi:MAG: hypothetical protein IKT34_02865, partial [Clostridia bacterium]|nr:hypothetical protein [Clostridia bacterium]